MKYLIIERHNFTCDKTGRTVITLVPSFCPKVTAHGKLDFAIWQVYEDEGEEVLNEALIKVEDNVRKVLKSFLE